MPAIVDLTALKAHVRKLDTSEDTILAAYLAAAIRYVEDYTGHVLASRSVTDVFYEWGTVLRLRHQPISGTPTIEYVDTEGDDQDYEGFVFRNALYPATIEPPYGDEFPTLGDNGTISVSYTAGYASGEVPAPLNQAILLLGGHWYTNRSAAGGEMSEVPFAVTALCRPYRGAVLA
jgi:uncharacterized phiE125 gp8 family phage protein